MNGFDFLQSAAWWRGVLSEAFGRSFWGFAAIAAALGLTCWAVKGGEVVVLALTEDLRLLIELMPRVAVALSVASLIWVMVPRDKMSALVGEESGIRGMAVATVAGAITPGGPSSAFALLAVMGGSGAGRGAMVAYITSWATLGLQRILIWDVPFMGAEFAMLRFAVSLPLPIIAGLIALRLPLPLTLKGGETVPPERARQ